MSYVKSKISGICEYFEREKSEKKPETLTVYINSIFYFECTYIEIMHHHLCGSFFRVIGEKEGYILSGPFENGLFQAHKLAEIQVSLIEDDGKPLQVSFLKSTMCILSTHFIIFLILTNYSDFRVCFYPFLEERITVKLAKVTLMERSRFYP